MIEIEHILHQEPLGIQHRDEQFIDPLPDALAHRNVFRLSEEQDAGPQSLARQTSPRQGSSQPPSINSTTTPLFIFAMLAVGA
jgi:hypothetical protein